MRIEFVRIDHIQICIPTGEELKGKSFYCDLLGLEEVEKPEALKKNGGFWLRAGDIQIHIGTEEKVSLSKRHPAFEVKQLSIIMDYLIKNGVRIRDETEIPGVKRFSFYDPWDNRIEFLEKL